MVLARNGYEAATGTYGTNGAAIPAAAGETALVAVVAGGSMTTVTTGAPVGARAMQFNPVASQALSNKATVTETSELAADFILRNAGTPSDEKYIFQARLGATNAFLLSHLPTGFLRIRMSSSSNIWTSTVVIPPTGDVKIAVSAVMDTTTPANSKIKAGLFTPGTLTPIGAGSSTGFVTGALGTTSLDSFQVGKVSANVDATSFVLDELRWDTNTTDYNSVSAPAANLPPTGSITTPSTATQNDQIDLRGTVADADGTVVSAVWSIPTYPATLSGPPVITNPGSMVSGFFVAVAPGTYGLRLSITDNDGATTVVNKTLTVAEIGGASRAVYLGGGVYR
jgi:hypothetical protein